MDDLKKTCKTISAALTAGKIEPDFFEIVRRFEQLHPERPRMGYAKRTSDDVIQFGQIPSLHFDKTQMVSLQDGTDGRVRLYESFFGVYGTNGPAPLALTSYVFQRSHNYFDRSPQRFTDIINNTFLRLYYRAYADCNAAISLDRPNSNNFALFFRALLGQPKGVAWNRFEERVLISQSSFLFNPQRGAVGLYNFLYSILRIPIAIEEHVVERCLFPKKYHCHLGNPDTAILGKNAQIGMHFISNTRKFNVHFGPISFEQFCQFFPEKQVFKNIVAVIMKFIVRPVDFDFIFHLIPDDLPLAHLDGQRSLGHGIWLGNPPKENVTVHLEARRIFMDKLKQRGKHI